jgi:hypothetical protein
MIGRNKVSVVVEAVTLQYANGKPQYRKVAGAGRFESFVGFHIEVGKHEELDEIMRREKTQLIEIKHPRPGGAEIVKHWCLGENVRFFPITSGPVAPTVAGCLGDNTSNTVDAGIGLRWGNGERSKMAVRGYLYELYHKGYDGLVQFSVRSRMTEELLKALIDHGRVCEALDGIIDRSRHPEVVYFHEVALPLGAGEETEWGKGDTSTVVPFMSLHPEVIDKAYAKTVWRPDEIDQMSTKAWGGIQQWARSYGSGKDEPQEESAPVVDQYEEEPIFDEEGIQVGPAPMAVKALRGNGKH